VVRTAERATTRQLGYLRAVSVILGTRACVRSDRWLLPSLPRTKNEAVALTISVTILDVHGPAEVICVRDLRPSYIEWSRPSMMLRQRLNRTKDVYCTARTGNGTPARFVRRRTLAFSSTTSRHTVGTKVTFLFAGTLRQLFTALFHRLICELPVTLLAVPLHQIAPQLPLKETGRFRRLHS